MTNSEKLNTSILFVKSAENSSALGRAFANLLPEFAAMQDTSTAIPAILSSAIPLVGGGIRRRLRYGKANNPEEQETINKKVLDDIKKFENVSYPQAIRKAILPNMTAGAIAGLGLTPITYSGLTDKSIFEDLSTGNKTNKVLLSMLLSSALGAAAGGVVAPISGSLGKFISNRISDESKERTAKAIAKHPILTGLDYYGVPSAITGRLS